jgi:hypothetical protein
MSKHLALLAILAGLPAARATAAEPAVKVGEKIHVCACGQKCPCDTMARKKGPCTCAREIKPMVEATVVKVEGNEAKLRLPDGTERSAVAIPKYACHCAAKGVSQTAGKCACGKDMVEVR